MDKKTQLFLAKLADVENERNYYGPDVTTTRINDYYSTPKNENEWVDGNALLRSSRPMPINRPGKFKTTMKSRPEGKIIYG